MSAVPLGRFIWYQLNARNLEAAVTFYGELLGFDAQTEAGVDGSPYVMFSRDGTPICGAMALPEEAKSAGAPQHWLCYISSPDVDHTLMEARDLGATVHLPPMDLEGIGRFAVIADPQGAAIAVYAPLNPGEDTPFEPAIGDVSWHELITSDWEAAFSFYSEIFGWEKTDAVDMGDIGTYQMFGRGGSTIGGMFGKTEQMPAPPGWLSYFRVDDVNQQVERVKKLGGQILMDPMEVPGGDLVANCMDAQGGAFAIHSVKR